MSKVGKILLVTGAIAATSVLAIIGYKKIAAMVEDLDLLDFDSCVDSSSKYYTVKPKTNCQPCSCSEEDKNTKETETITAEEKETDEIVE